MKQHHSIFRTLMVTWIMISICASTVQAINLPPIDELIELGLNEELQDHLQSLSIEEQKEQLRDWIVISANVQLNSSEKDQFASLYDFPAMRYDFMRTPNEKIQKATNKELAIDEYLQLKSIWERYILALANKLLSTNLLEDFITQKEGKQSSELLEKFKPTINIYLKNLIQNSNIEVEGNLQLGDQYTNTKN